MGIAVCMKCSVAVGRHTHILFSNPVGGLCSVWSVLEGKHYPVDFGIRLGMRCEVAGFKGSIAAF